MNIEMSLRILNICFVSIVTHQNVASIRWNRTKLWGRFMLNFACPMVSWALCAPRKQPRTFPPHVVELDAIRQNSIQILHKIHFPDDTEDVLHNTLLDTRRRAVRCVAHRCIAKCRFERNVFLFQIYFFHHDIQFCCELFFSRRCPRFMRIETHTTLYY